MVENTLRAIDKNVAYRGVRASRGKIVRAEPISALYEQGRIHHAGCFAELENQLCTFAGGSRNSPDRLDALVYALSDLMVGICPQPTPIVAPVLIDNPAALSQTMPSSLRAGRNPFANDYSAEARAYADPRSSGFSIRRS